MLWPLIQRYSVTRRDTKWGGEEGRRGGGEGTKHEGGEEGRNDARRKGGGEASERAQAGTADSEIAAYCKAAAL
jgi:hypothetical protein